MDILTRDAQREKFGLIGLELPTESAADEIYENIRRAGQDSLYFFTTAILKWNLLKPTPHLPLCNFLQRVPPAHPEHKRRKLVLIPRDCFKSTVASKSLPLWILIQKEFCGLPGLEHRILCISFSGDNASKQLKSISSQIERNELLRWLYPEIIPDLSTTTWTAKNLLFPREGMYGEDTIEAAGIDTHIVSRHYTVQIKDDIEDKEAAESPSVRKKVKDSYKSFESLFVSEQEAYDAIIGTRWGIDDVYSDIITNESEFYEKYVRPLHWTREDLEADLREAQESKKPAVYDMSPDEHAPDSTRTYYFFPELFPEESCRRVRAKQGQWMYSMLYLNNPKDPSLAEFKVADLLWWVYDDDGNIILDNAAGEKELIYFDDLKRVEFWDPAIGAKDVKMASRNALVVAYRDRWQRIFIAEAFAEIKDPALLLDKFIGFHQRHLVKVAAVEDAGFQRFLKYGLYQRMREHNYHFPVREQRPIGDKDARIRTLQPFSESRLLCVRRGLRDFVEELKGFPVFPTKDLLDAAAACVPLFGIQAVQSGAGVRQDSRPDDRLATRNERTGY